MMQQWSPAMPVREHPGLPSRIWDVDVTCGRVPARPEASADADAVLDIVAAEGISRCALTSLRAALFDVSSGNDEVVSAATARPSAVAVAAVDLRDGTRIEPELARLSGSVRAVRLLGPEQAKDADGPAVAEAVRCVRELGIPLFVGGPFSAWWRPFIGQGLDVVFLDLHFYELGDFLLAARSDEGFRCSTRLLNSPDGLERVAGELGPDRLLLGTGTPRFEAAAPLLRLAASRLSPADKAAAAWDNAARLLDRSPLARSVPKQREDA